MSVSLLILTLNEEVNLPHCLASLEWADDVVVLDSGSDDATQEIARQAGARVEYRAFDDYSSQRNYGLQDIKYKYPWVLMVDADEIVPPELVQEIAKTVSICPDSVCMYRIRRKDYLMGKWLRWSSGYPTWFGRLVRVGHIRVERSINEEYITDGEVESLGNHLIHYPFNKGFHSWIEKHNRYSTMEAVEKLQNKNKKISLKALFSRNPVDRRKAQKALIYTMPGRPTLVFILFYIVRGGFLDGRAGLTFCRLKMIYEYMIDCKIRELKRKAQGLPL